MNPNSTQSALDENFLKTLQATLLEKSDVISSEDTRIETKIGEAIAGIQTAQQKSTQRIESQMGREISNEKRLVAGELNTFREEERGYAVSMSALRELTKTGTKRIDDLEQRKQELILAGESAAAEKIASLQLQELQLQQEARQRTFQNLLSLGNFGLGIQQEERLAKAQSFQERSAIASLALQFGIPVSDSDTIDTIVSKAAPMATERQKLELAKMQAEIRNLNARTQEALNGSISMSMDATNIQALAMAARRDPNLYGQIAKNPELFAKVVNMEGELEKIDILDTINAWTGNKDSLISVVGTDPSIKDKAGAMKLIESEWAKRPSVTTTKKTTNIRDILDITGSTIIKGMIKTGEFFTPFNR